MVEGEHLRLAAKNIPASIWARDAAAFAPAGSAPEGISHNLGWLDAPFKMEPELAGIAAFAAEVRKAGFRRAVLLGMGGSALNNAVFSNPNCAMLAMGHDYWTDGSLDWILQSYG